MRHDRGARHARTMVDETQRCGARRLSRGSCACRLSRHDSRVVEPAGQLANVAEVTLDVDGRGIAADAHVHKASTRRSPVALDRAGVEPGLLQFLDDLVPAMSTPERGN